MDVLWLPDSHLPLEQRAPLVVAHDWEDAERRTPLTADRGARRLPRAAAATGRDRPRHQAARQGGGAGRGAARARPGRAGDDLDDGDAHAAPRPRTGAGAAARLDLSQSDQGLDPQALGARPMLAAMVAMRHRLPGLAAEKLPQFGVEAMWVYHPLVSPRLARICDLAGVELIAWTVDDARADGEARRRRRPRPRLQRPPPVRSALTIELVGAYRGMAPRSSNRLLRRRRGWRPGASPCRGRGL